MRKKLSIENLTLLEEWNSEKNKDLCPDDYTGGSNKKVWWKCELGHSWEAQINKRFTFGRNCPYCSGNKVWQGYNDIVTTHPHIADEWDYEKNESLRPEQFSIGADKKIWWKCKCGHSWQALIYSRKNCGCPACASNILVTGVNDLLTVNPAVASEWDTVKNGPMRPDSVAANNNEKAWWKCERGHSWQAVISSRNNGKGCPYCTNRKLLSDFNDLLSVAPELACEWNYEKNGDLIPENVLAGSHKSVWWKCRYGHEWMSQIVNRRNGCGCPYDAGKLVISGETDLKTRYPDLCKEWDTEKNGQITPDKIACYSHERYWWICPKGHSYQASSANRIRNLNEGNGNGCPYCAGKRPIVGETDFRTAHPELISEWDFEKNGKHRPEDFTVGSHKKIWWKCERGHSWKLAVFDRVKSTECPYCSGRLAIPGETDFGSILPELADEWDIQANGEIVPEDFKPYSNKRVWWCCKNGHKWLSAVGARFSGSTCPYCHGKVQMRTRLVK